MIRVDKNDQQFQRFVRIVTPEERVQPVLFGVDFIAILELLYQIFTLLKELGCFAKAAYTREVKAAMRLDRGQCQATLEMVLHDLIKKKEKKRMKHTLFMIFFLLPLFGYAKEAPKYVGLEKPKQVYSAKYQKFYWTGLAKHLLQTEGLDESYKLADIKVPNHYSLVEKFGLPPGFPYDQKDCGSCVVNAIVAAVTYNLWIRGLLPNQFSPLSRGQVMECNPSAGQCQGDWAENVGNWVGSRGKLLPESVYPYRPRNGRCQGITGTEYGPIPKGRVIDNSEESIGKALATANALPITIGAGGAFMNYQSGTITQCQDIGTNHEVLLVGIDCLGAAAGADGFCNFAAARPGDIVFTVLNSWGQWGDKGFFKIVAKNSRGARCYNVAEEVYAFAFDPYKPPTPPDPDPKPPTPSDKPVWLYVIFGVLALVGVVVFVVKR